MLLESLIGTESKASPQLPSRLCPGTDSQALLSLACRLRLTADTQADGGLPTTLDPASLASASLVGRNLFLA